MNKRKAIIIDIDNTLCIDKIQTVIPSSDKRSEWDKFHIEHEWYKVDNFIPIQETIDYVNFLYNKYQNNVMFIFMSAREDHINSKVQWNTLRFIFKYFPQFNAQNYGKNYMLILRCFNDFRTDEKVKKDLYNMFINGTFEPYIAIDDKKENVQMFKEVGVPLVIQVHGGKNG